MGSPKYGSQLGGLRIFIYHYSLMCFWHPSKVACFKMDHRRMLGYKISQEGKISC